MVNVCDQEDPIAITKNYEVTTGNHIALQGEYDGKCRPNIYGNTLWIDNDTEEILMAFDGTKNLRLQSSFEDKLITDEKDAHNGKYKVDYKVTGKNKVKLIPNNLYKNAGTMTIDSCSDNQLTFSITDNTDNWQYIRHKLTGLKPNTDYVCSFTISSGDTSLFARIYGDSSSSIDTTIEGDKTKRKFNTSNYDNIYIRFFGILDTPPSSNTVTYSNIQIEEGTKATTYESYKEYTKTLYLNTPLLEGDTIEQSGNDIVHNHKYGKVVLDGINYVPALEKIIVTSGNYRWTFVIPNIKNSISSSTGLGICDKYPIVTPNDTWNSIEGITQNNSGNKIVLYLDKYKDGSDASKQALINELSINPITFVYEKDTPTKEVISTNDNLLLDSYVNGHLDVDSVIPIDKVVFQSYGTSLKYLSPNTEYTIQFESDSNGKLDALALNSSDVIGNLNIVKGVNKFNITTSDKITINYLWTTGIGFNMSKIVVTPKVDGDFGYFKGMKSVGQNDVDGHKIEILSNNKNILDNLIPYPFDITKDGGLKKNDGALLGIVKVKPNTTYIMSVTRDKKAGRVIAKMSNKIILATELPYGLFTQNYIYNFLRDNYANGRSFEKTLYDQDFIKFTTFSDCNYLYVNVDCNYKMDNGINEVTINNVQIEEVKDTSTSPTTYVPHQENKKEILMNEPLRGLPNGVRDKYVMIDGKWYIERNTIQLIMDSTFIQDKKLYHYASTNYPDVIGFSTPNNWFKWNSSLVCDNLVYDGHRNISAGSLISNQEKIFVYDLVFITLNKNKLSSLNEDGFREYLKNNPITLVGQNTTPTYEPIDYNPFEVYTDTTHISNNSTIPCNMVIKNTGYNCILKPSTLYTVALDTNKSGTIGMNLGGVKGTTSNNVATITTPATLTDNTLRLYGKGIKGSKVRLLEGDRTNWIPSHFEGMKSCFEDKLQDDGKYKMEILSRNSDESLSNKIQFLLNEPLRGVGNVKDKVYVKKDKIVVERNCGSVTFDGSDTWNLNKIENNIYTYSIRSTKFLTKMKVGTWETLMNNKCYIIDKCGTATTSTPKNEQLLIHNTVEDKFIWYSTPLFSTVQSVKQYLNDNPFKILYQLETPVYEEVEYSNNRLTLDTYDNSTLIYDSNIPVSNTSFKPLWEELVYVKNSTTYYIQFNAVGSGNVVVNLGGTELSTTITEGYNKIEITTPNNSTNLLTIDGQGIKISKVVVSEALCSGYYKGLQSCFEEHMENGKYVCVIRGISLDGNKVNGIKFYLNEPLRGIGDIKDKLCIKDNKLMVERNFIQVIIDGENLQNYNNFAYRTLFDFKCNVLHNWELANFITDSKFSNAFIDYQWNHRDFESIAVSPLDEKTCIDIIDKSISFSIDSYKNILKEKPIKVVYQLLEPIYEEITNEYGLPIILEGYENGIVYVDSAVTPTTSIKYTSNNTVPTTLSNVDNLNATTQDDINNNIVTYMMDIDMMLTEMEMEDNASIMSLSDSDDNNQKHNRSHNNILDRMNEEDRIKYQDNTTKMLEKVIKGKSLTNEENINRIDLYLSEGKIREEQSNYLKELLKGDE